MRRSLILLVPFLAACGPSVNEPVAQSTGDGSSGAASTGDASTSTSSASGAMETSAATGESSSAADETAATEDELPPEAAGVWLCTGWEDPIFLRLEPGTTMPWDGTACGPDLSGNPPPKWSNCDDLGFGHPNVTNTQAYWIFELDYSFAGGSVLSFDLGVDYVPASDTLEGYMMLNELGAGLIPETCMRYER